MPRKWSAEVKNVENNIVTLTLQTAPTAFIGKWQLSIVTVLNPKEEEHKGHEEEDHEKPKKMVEHYRQKDPIYLIFNPWCKGRSQSAWLVSITVIDGSRGPPSPWKLHQEWAAGGPTAFWTKDYNGYTGGSDGPRSMPPCGVTRLQWVNSL